MIMLLGNLVVLGITIGILIETLALGERTPAAETSNSPAEKTSPEDSRGPP